MKKKIRWILPVMIFVILIPAKPQQADNEWSIVKKYKEKLQIDKLYLTVDNQNHRVVTGFFTDYARVNETTIKSKGSLDILIAKFDENDNLLWYKHEGGSNIDFSRFVNTDSKDNIYIQGLYRGKTQFEDVRLNSKGTWDFFTVKYDNQGKLIWVKTKKTNPVYSDNS